MDASAQREIDKLQAIWQQIAYERDGVREPLDDEKDWNPRTTFVGNSFIGEIADGSIPIKGTFKIDPSQNPKAIDYTDTHGADAGKTFLAIYELEGDLFTFCAASDGQKRPTDFTTQLGEVLRVNRRVSSVAAAIL